MIFVDSSDYIQNTVYMTLLYMCRCTYMYIQYLAKLRLLSLGAGRGPPLWDLVGLLQESCLLYHHVRGPQILRGGERGEGGGEGRGGRGGRGGEGRGERGGERGEGRGGRRGEGERGEERGRGEGGGEGKGREGGVKVCAGYFSLPNLTAFPFPLFLSLKSLDIFILLSTTLSRVSFKFTTSFLLLTFEEQTE